MVYLDLSEDVTIEPVSPEALLTELPDALHEIAHALHEIARRLAAIVVEEELETIEY